MSTLDFSISVSYGNISPKTRLQSFLETVEDTFFLGGKKAIVIPGKIEGKSYETELFDYRLTEKQVVAKVALYCTVVFPLFMFVAKVILRSIHQFHIKALSLGDLSVSDRKINHLAGFIARSILKQIEGPSLEGYNIHFRIQKVVNQWLCRVEVPIEKPCGPIKRPVHRMVPHCNKCLSVFDHTYNCPPEEGPYKRVPVIGNLVEKYGILATSDEKLLLLSVNPKKGLLPDDYLHMIQLSEDYHSNEPMRMEKLKRVCGALLATMNFLHQRGISPDEYFIGWHVGSCGTIDTIHTRIHETTGKLSKILVLYS